MRDFIVKFVFAFFLTLLLLPGCTISQNAENTTPETIAAKNTSEDIISEDTTGSIGIFDLLTKNEVAKVSLKTNLSSLMENKRSKEYLKGDFTFSTEKDVDMTVPVKLRLRGRYRRMKCEFPPIKLKFRKADLADQGLNEFNELKLVTHCLEDENVSRELVCREYLVYRLFNLLSPNSFRAQLVNVTYLNTKKKPKKVKGWGILIEDADELAHRMQGERFEQMGLPDSCFNKQQENLTALFQFMVGNSDWSNMMVRNVEFVKFSDTDIYPIPYDFDFSGVVAAPYARPNFDVGQTNIRHRVFQGKAAHFEEIEPTIQHFLDNKDAVLSEVMDFDLLSRESRKDIRDYLVMFYDTIEDKQKATAAMFPEKDGKAGK